MAKNKFRRVANPLLTCPKPSLLGFPDLVLDVVKVPKGATWCNFYWAWATEEVSKFSGFQLIAAAN